MYKILGNGEPVRLFVGGLHGNEWIDTSDILEGLQAPKIGTLIIMSVIVKNQYISTLDNTYYSTLGSPIIKTIKELCPSIYVEFHSYSKKNKDSLTDTDRIEKKGVPAFSELNYDVLMGSVSPIIRKELFTCNDLCLSFEIQKDNPLSKKYTKKLAVKLKECLSKDQFIIQFSLKYPQQSKKVIEDYRNFYGL